MSACKISMRAPRADLARTLEGALENLTEPPPEAVTRFEDGAGGWLVEAYYAGAPDLAAIARVLEAALGSTPPALDLTSVPDLNWVAISQAALPPVAAGRFTVHGSHDRKRIPRGPNAILIDAGEAFGTAHHATTQGCLRAIDRLSRRQSFARVLDLGCGSGVLAIAAARALPHADVMATDWDPAAIAVAEANARANGVAGRIAFACAKGLHHPWLRHGMPFDLVVANILAGPLIALAPGLAGAVRRGGVLVLSGLLDREAAGVTSAYVAVGFSLVEQHESSGWTTLVLRRRQ